MPVGSQFEHLPPCAQLQLKPYEPHGCAAWDFEDQKKVRSRIAINILLIHCLTELTLRQSAPLRAEGSRGIRQKRSPSGRITSPIAWKDWDISNAFSMHFQCIITHVDLKSRNSCPAAYISCIIWNACKIILVGRTIPNCEGGDAGHDGIMDC